MGSGWYRHFIGVSRSLSPLKGAQVEEPRHLPGQAPRGWLWTSASSIFSSAVQCLRDEASLKGLIVYTYIYIYICIYIHI